LSASFSIALGIKLEANPILKRATIVQNFIPCIKNLASKAYGNSNPLIICPLKLENPVLIATANTPLLMVDRFSLI
jgi:hypothetical protein